jgi:hypothetical protein
VLAIYPGEGHGVRQFPAVIDQCARMVEWFERHMPARAKAKPRAGRRAKSASKPRVRQPATASSGATRGQRTRRQA